ncbi:hypothetical protein [Novosphingobium sp. 17-62-19]|uniref:hypothetical protein n=1 Tax=Novosphingobium sp. 17-62-19 TaxID=1970406 RepID=UPI0025F70382|nr:hypothetical protein [Novosphingobium sp. 17-62-19]
MEEPVKYQEIIFELEFDEDDFDKTPDAFSLNKVGAIFHFNGGHMEIREIVDGFGFDQAQLVTLAVSFSLGVSSGVVANVVYALCKSAVRNISVQGRRVRFSEDEIEQAIRTFIEQSKQKDDEST